MVSDETAKVKTIPEEADVGRQPLSGANVESRMGCQRGMSPVW